MIEIDLYLPGFTPAAPPRTSPIPLPATLNSLFRSAGLAVADYTAVELHILEQHHRESPFSLPELRRIHEIKYLFDATVHNQEPVRSPNPAHENQSR